MRLHRNVKGRIVRLFVLVLIAVGGQNAFCKIILNQNFDDNSTFDGSNISNAGVGNTATKEGLWNSWGEVSYTNWPHSTTNQYYSGTQSIAVTRTTFPQGRLYGHVDNGVSSGKFEFSYRMRLDNTSSCALILSNYSSLYTNSPSTPVGVFLNIDGQVYIYSNNTAVRPHADNSMIFVPRNQWIAFKLAVDLDAQTYDVYYSHDGSDYSFVKINTITPTFNTSLEYNCVLVCPQSPAGTTYIDDIVWQAGAIAPYRPDLYTSSVYLSTGDFFNVTGSVAVESENTIEASFDCFKEYHNADRIIWRDAQVQWYNTFCNYREISRFDNLWQYWISRDCTSLAKTKANDIGASFWGIMPLFDLSGAPAFTHSLTGNGPFYWYDPMRQNDPEPSLYVNLFGGNNNAVTRYDVASGVAKYTINTENHNDGTNLGICVGPDATGDNIPDVYVAGYYSANVSIYDGVTGSYVKEFVVANEGGIIRVCCIAFGPDRNLYAADAVGNKIYCFDGTTGTYINTPVTGLNIPIGIAWGPDANMYVTTIGDNRIRSYTPSGVLRWTSSGTQPVVPYNPVFKDGKVFIPSRGDNRVLCYDMNTGVYSSTFIPSGGNLSEPVALAFGPDTNDDGVNDLYVANNGNNTILRYSGSNGAYIDTYITPFRPGGIVFSPVKYAATNKQGLMSGAGTLEYAYPEVRDEYVRRFNYMFNETDGPFRHYAGIQLYTYVENFFPRFDDEFIYSDAVDAEYVRRYGRNPRDPANAAAYNAIRGEFLTQFLREIRPVFNKYSKKLCIALNAANLEQPNKWDCAGTPYTLPQGKIKMEWQTWISEGLVDELTIWGASDNELRQSVPIVMAAISGTSVKLSICRSSSNPIPPPDLLYVLNQGVQMEYNQMLATAGYPDDVYTPVTSDINSNDAMKVLAVLYECYEVAKGRSTMTLPDASLVINKLNDSNPVIRNMAAVALGRCNMAGAENAFISRLAIETETKIKSTIISWMAPYITNSTSSVQAIITALNNEPVYQLRLAATETFNVMPATRYSDIAAGYLSSNPIVRRAVLMSNLSSKDFNAAFSLYADAGLNDPDWRNRYEAARSLVLWDNDAYSTLYTMLDDPNDAVSSIAALSLRPGAINEVQAATKLRDMFLEYGDGSTRTDKDYGWLYIGWTLDRECGSTGRAYLTSILNDPTRKDAGILAWHVRYAPSTTHYIVKTPAQVDSDYTYYPW